MDNLKDIINSKDPESINLFVTLASGLNSIAWCSYSVLASDIYIFIPTFIGIIVFAILMLLYFWTLDLITSELLILRVFIWLFKDSSSVLKVKIDE